MHSGGDEDWGGSGSSIEPGTTGVFSVKLFFYQMAAVIQNNSKHFYLSSAMNFTNNGSVLSSMQYIKTQELAQLNRFNVVTIFLLWQTKMSAGKKDQSDWTNQATVGAAGL